MSVDRAVFVFAGLVVLLSIGLSLTVHPWWIALAAFTGFCPAAMVFKALGLKPGVAFR